MFTSFKVCCLRLFLSLYRERIRSSVEEPRAKHTCMISLRTFPGNSPRFPVECFLAIEVLPQEFPNIVGVLVVYVGGGCSNCLRLYLQREREWSSVGGHVGSLSLSCLPAYLLAFLLASLLLFVWCPRREADRTETPPPAWSGVFRGDGQKRKNARRTPQGAPCSPGRPFAQHTCRVYCALVFFRRHRKKESRTKEEKKGGDFGEIG